jgi:hypothetical protein
MDSYTVCRNPDFVSDSQFRVVGVSDSQFHVGSATDARIWAMRVAGLLDTAVRYVRADLEPTTVALC